MVIFHIGNKIISDDGKGGDILYGIKNIEI
jgi:hypothetical protein